MSEAVSVDVHPLASWADVAKTLDYFMGQSWVFRGQECAAWGLETSLEREFRSRRKEVELQTLWHFVRRAPQLLPAHLVPSNQLDAAVWLGLIQHYGGPTRLLDVTLSPYVALYFAFEASGDNDRALWAIDSEWCRRECARIMSANEGSKRDRALARVRHAQAQLVAFLVHGRPSQIRGLRRLYRLRAFSRLIHSDPIRGKARNKHYFSVLPTWNCP
jgi:FRG domain-containing protein